MMLHQIVKLETLLWLLMGITMVAGTLSPPSAQELEQKKLSRKKRWLAFPDGSSVSASICLTIGVIGNQEVTYMSWAENWGIAYDLPNYTWAVANYPGVMKIKKPTVLRRSRRDLYEKIELAIDSMGFNGHACIARALCESSKYFQPLKRRRGNMIEELVRTVFSFPSAAVDPDEPAVIYDYDRIYRRASLDFVDCSLEYAECHFSLLDMALGKYSVPPTKHGPNISPFIKFM